MGTKVAFVTDPFVGGVIVEFTFFSGPLVIFPLVSWPFVTFLLVVCESVRSLEPETSA